MPHLYNLMEKVIFLEQRMLCCSGSHHINSVTEHEATVVFLFLFTKFSTLWIRECACSSITKKPVHCLNFSHVISP